ncbi:flagellar basal-body rod protein [Prevotella nigrescens ATCC 33563]|nr:flagellar basal-body rod protein [Prevotella nigrescens ATCC 33563]
MTPQRYNFLSKSQQVTNPTPQIKVVIDTTKIQLFKQITTKIREERHIQSCN